MLLFFEKRHLNYFGIYTEYLDQEQDVLSRIMISWMKWISVFNDSIWDFFTTLGRRFVSLCSKIKQILIRTFDEAHQLKKY